MRHGPNLCVIICLSRTFRQDVKAILTKITKKIISQKITLKLAQELWLIELADCQPIISTDDSTVW